MTNNEITNANPTNHEELFKAFLVERISTICEFSGNISENIKALKYWAHDYVRNNNELLNIFGLMDFIDSHTKDYIFDDE